MSQRGRTIARWAPRILAGLLGLFLSLLTFDVWFEGYPFPQALLGWLVHMVPTFCVIAAIAVAWRRPALGTVAFALVAVLLFRLSDARESLVGFLLLVFPPLLIAILYGLSWRLADTQNDKEQGS